MKKLMKTIAIAVLTLTLYAFPVFADCGEMGNGSKCLVQNPTEPTKTSKLDSKNPVNPDALFAKYFADIFVKIIF